jgi:alkaline phosphatase D
MVIAADQPLGLIVYEDFVRRWGVEAVAQGMDGPPRGRELEIADLLAFIKHSGIRNTVWLTADVHYTAAHYYDPNKAAFQDFEPFWEFVSNPIHAGCFPKSELDSTFVRNLCIRRRQARSRASTCRLRPNSSSSVMWQSRARAAL